MSELASLLRQRVTIERKSRARDALGGSTGEWTSLGSSWAELRAQDNGRWTATLRSTADVVAGDRLVWRGRRLRVTAAVADPWAADRLRLACEERS